MSLDAKKCINKIGVVFKTTDKIPIDYRYPQGVFPPSTPFIVQSITETSSDTLYINYWTKDGQAKAAYIPQTFQLTIVRGKLKNELLEEYLKYQLNNIHTVLYNKAITATGSDPEIFVENKDGSLIPAFTFLGSKASPNFTLPDMRAGQNDGAKKVYWDGFQAEFETYPHSCLSWQVDSVQAGMKAVLRLARLKFPDAKLSSRTVFEIPDQLLRESNDEHVNFGCMPSKNVYGMKGVDVPGRELPFRSAGGHIHFGLHDQYKSDKQIVGMVKTLDAILGVACVSLFAKFDDPRRRRFYGMAGEYRTPQHGMEYRVLSNAWMIHPLIQNLVFDVARKCVALSVNNMFSLWKVDEKEVIKCINDCDVIKAQEILERNKELFVKMIGSCYRGADTGVNNHIDDNKVAESLFNIFKNGLETIIANPNDLHKNWNLDDTWRTHSGGVGKYISISKETIVAGQKVA